MGTRLRWASIQAKLDNFTGNNKRCVANFNSFLSVNIHHCMDITSSA